MTLLTKNSQPAERERGLIFSETFENAQKVVLNGGVITGSPVIDREIAFDGATDNVSYDKNNQKFNFGTNDMSVSLWFKTTTAGFQTLIDNKTAGTPFKGFNIYMNTDSHKVTFRIGNGTTAGNVEGTSAVDDGNWHYVAGVVDRAEDKMYIYVDGVLETSSSATFAGWDISGAGDLFIGSYSVNAGLFNGDIKDVKIYDTALIQQEITDSFNNATYNYRNETVLDLPMGMEQHDATNTRTLDISGGGNHAILVSDPTKLTDTKGYDLDGVADYMTGTGTGVFNSTEISIAMKFSPDFNWDDDNYYLFYDSTNGSRFYIWKGSNLESSRLDIGMGGTTVGSVASTTYSQFWKVGEENIFIVTGDNTNNFTNVWLNGNHIMIDDTTAWAVANPPLFSVGAGFNGASKFNGKIHYFKVWNRLLTPTQVADLTYNSLKGNKSI